MERGLKRTTIAQFALTGAKDVIAVGFRTLKLTAVF